MPSRAKLKYVPRIPGRHFVKNLVERRALVAQLVRRDFQQRYVGSAAGWLWGVVQPLVMLASWIFVFQICLKVPLPEGVRNYPVFLFAGFLPWMLFQETVTRSAGSLVEHANMITRTVFPSEVVPVSIFLSSLIHHLIGVTLAGAAAAIVFHGMNPVGLALGLALLPVYMLAVGLLSVGVGWIAASLHVYLRDTGQVLTVAMTLWFWLTPIMITEQQIPPRFHILVAWNPMAFVVRAYRERLLSASWPHWNELAILSAYCSLVFIAGGLFFRHLKRGFADVL